jgi:hypothetical protein
VSLEHSPARQTGKRLSTADSGTTDELEADYWQRLIDEKIAADFLGLTIRTMQAMRQRGGGPRFVVISARCIRYRRIDLRAWAEARLRTSTSDPGQAGPAA